MDSTTRDTILRYAQAGKIELIAKLFAQRVIRALLDRALNSVLGSPSIPKLSTLDHSTPPKLRPGPMTQLLTSYTANSPT